MVFYSYPFILKNLEVIDGIAGIIVAIATILTLGTRVVTGFVLDFRLPKNALIFSHLVYISAFFMLQSSQVWLVFSGRILIGLSLGITATLLVYYSIIGEKDSKGKSKSVSLMTFFGILPTCIAPFFTLKVAEHFGVDVVTQIAILMLFISLVLSYFVDKNITVRSAGKEQKKTLLKDFLSMLNRPEIKLVITLLLFTYVISGTTVTFLPMFLEEKSTKVVSWYFLVFSIFMILPRFLLQNKMPDGSVFPLAIFVSCVVMGLVGNLINLLLIDSVFILVGAALNGATLGIMYPSVMAFTVCSVNGNTTASVSSIVAGSADCGVFLANLLLGIISFKLNTEAALLIPIATSVICVLLLATYLLKYGSAFASTLDKGITK